MVKSPQLASAFHSSLLPCLTDPGVSVRKRAVQIFRQILVKNPRYKGRSAVCNIMLQRFGDPKEEDTVHDLIEELFCELWLRDGDEEISSPGTAAKSENDGSFADSSEVASIPGVVTPSSPVPSSNRKIRQRRSDVAAEQMMEVVRAGNTGDHLEALLKKLLSGGRNSESTRKSAERKKRQQLGKTQCTQLVNSLFELLLVVEEQRDIRVTVGKDIAFYSPCYCCVCKCVALSYLAEIGRSFTLPQS